MRKIVLRGNDKPHMTSQLKRGIMKVSRLKKQIKVVNLPIKQLIRHRNLVVEEAKKSFLKIQIKKQNATNKTKKFWKLCKLFFSEKGFHYKQKFTRKTKRGVTSSEATIAYIFNNFFVDIRKSLNIPAWNPENSRNLEKMLRNV